MRFKNYESVNKKIFYVSVILAFLIIVIFVAAYAAPMLSDSGSKPITGSAISAKRVSAEEIYPQFICPCCGQLLDKNNVCCGAAKERIDYIDSLVDDGISENDVVIKMVQKYGIDSLSSEFKKEEVKKELAKSAPEDRPIINIEPDAYDFGDVSVAKGVVSTIMTMRNGGNDDLIINNIDSSCMCTTASIISNGVEGPRFGMSMHGNPKGWSVTIPPGKEAQLKIYYDPTVHPDIVGQHLVRIISVFSNDPVNFEKKIRVDIDQVA